MNGSLMSTSTAPESDARQPGEDSTPLHPHRTWSRDKAIEVETNQMKPTDHNQGPDADKYPLTPTMAVQWQFLDFTQFKESVNHDMLTGLDRTSWAEYNTAENRYWNVAELEKKVLASGSKFAKHLSDIQSELSEPVQPTVYNLPNVLRDLSEDDHPLAARIWVRLSRGVDVIPASIIEDMQPTSVENYPVSDPLVRKQVPAEIQRHFDKGFATPANGGGTALRRLRL
eukprot:COSAG01_NODE_8683_length_2697_cov_19.167436_2_plen_228_part_00